MPAILMNIQFGEKSLHMRMGKEMLLAVLIISVAFGAETELQHRIILVRPSADRTLMFCDLRIALDFMPELRPSLHLLRRHMDMASGGKEKDDEIQQ